MGTERGTPGGPPGASMDGPVTLQGTIEVVTFTSAETLYSVLRVRPEDGQELPSDGLFRPARITAVGRAPGPEVGQRVRITGR